jgi:hypothetical protein
LTKKRRKTRLWQFDPSVFQPGSKASFLERYVLGRAKSIAKYTLYSLAFLYPIVLVSLGIMFGGLVFWGAFAGSVGLMWLVITRTGYAKNFAGWGVVRKTWLIEVVGAFSILLAFFYGLIHMDVWFLPIFGGVVIVALVVGRKWFLEK